MSRPSTIADRRPAVAAPARRRTRAPRRRPPAPAGVAQTQAMGGWLAARAGLAFVLVNVRYWTGVAPLVR
jgi:hypothetical protein